MRKPLASTLVSAMILTSVAACGPPAFKHRDAGTRNVTIGAARTSRGLLYRYTTNVAFYNETSPCEWKYQGSIKLDNQPKQTGIPVGQRTLVQFNFVGRGPGKSISSATAVIKAKPATRYSIDMFMKPTGGLFSRSSLTGYTVTENGRAINPPTQSEVCG